MFRRLYRQRRRFFVASLLATLALADMIASGRLPDTDEIPLDNWIASIAIIVTALIVSSGLILVTTYVLPGLRHGLETMLLTILVAPRIIDGLEIAGVANGGVAPLIVIATFVVIEQLFYGRHLDRFTIPLPRRKVRLRTKSPPEQAWTALAPLPENSGRHFYPGTIFEAAENGAVRAIYPLKGGQTYQVELITPEEVSPPNRLTTRFEPAEKTAGSGGLSGTQTIDIAPRADGGSEITIAEKRDPTPLRRHLQFWFDDELGDRADCMRYRIDDRHDWSIFKYQCPKPARLGNAIPD